MKQKMIQKRYQLFIGGKWSPSMGEDTFQTHSPANGDLLATCVEACTADVDKAVAAAQEAWKSWRVTSPAQRAAVLNKVADVIEDNGEFLARLDTMDNGKPIRETMGVDIPEAAAHFRYFAGAVLTEEGAATMLDRNTLNLILQEPIGVVGQIVPWNSPFLMAAWKLAPALAAGCCVVFKPSSNTPLSVLEFADLTKDSIPPGVLNVVTGSGGKAGQFILHHKNIQKLAFTGSTEVGREVVMAAAHRLIPATLELSGKSANIFFADCNWELAMDGLQMGILFNQGQVYSAGSRVFVQEDIYDRFVLEAVKRFASIQVGDPLIPSTQIGTMISTMQLKKVLQYIRIGQEEGATVVCGGNRIVEGSMSKGYYMQPTLLTDVHNDMRVAKKEIFGPVACVIKFRSEQEAIEMANDSDFGLSGAVWTQDINRAIRVANAVHTGRMWVNTYNAMPAGAPFGGYKLSGIGREAHKMALRQYSQTKSIMINLSNQPSGLY